MCNYNRHFLIFLIHTNMQDNIVLIDFKFSKLKINQYLKELIDQYIGQKINADGYEIILKKSNEDIKITASQKSIQLDLPVNFMFIKPAGLFSIEGEGEIKVQLEFAIEIDSDFGLKTASKLNGHHWVKDPVLHVGEMNIPFETISNCIIKFMKESMLEKLDQKISETADIKKLIKEQITQFATNYPVYKKPDLYFNGQLHQIQADVFKDEEKDIHIDLWLEFQGKISDEPLKFEVVYDPKFFWLDKSPGSGSQKINIEMSYAGLARMIMSELNGKEVGGKKFELESVNIRNTNKLEIKANLLAPIKGIVTMICQPSLDKESQKIYSGDIDIDIDAQNFIYKLSSPILENILRSKISAMMPFDPTPYLQDFLTRIPQIKLMDNKISLLANCSQVLIEKLDFGDNKLICVLWMKDAELDVEV